MFARLQRNGDRKEDHGERKMDGRGDARLGHSHQDEVESAKKHCDPGKKFVVMRILQDGIERQRCKGSIGQRKKNFGDKCPLLLCIMGETHRRSHENEEEQHDEDCRNREWLAYVERTVKFGVPANEKSYGRGKGPE